MAANEQDAPLYEAEHVHNIYDQIASHFSSTRYKPWPVVERFLLNISPGSIGLDVGCGNGKYLSVNRDIFIIASDRSHNLARIASVHQPHTALVADILDLPFHPSSFDFVISIAVVHHLATRPRRVAAISSLLQALRSSSMDSIEAPSLTTDKQNSYMPQTMAKVLIQVWALEQKDSRRGWDTGDAQDVMVPWVMKSQQRGSRTERKTRHVNCSSHELESNVAFDHDLRDESKQQEPSERVFRRYYHLYREGELEQDIEEAGGRVLESGYERDNWWAIATRSSD